ncbi:hypothetical protein EJ08DRAFT_673168 [Tothia fuscella]|uniref:Uncharacterized protein n=1 Tax=Tothia fuscella TaxID=1048955 RepID=A0A9P4NGI1_9PEZI|nr:hypothetical protein EJ08DRAFT_673168 [Tothia fuscella]
MATFQIHLQPISTRKMLTTVRRQDLQTFDGKLGGVEAPAIVMSNTKDRPFSVQGDTFPDFQTAAQRTCDKQHTGCSNAANNDGGGKGKRARQNRDNLTTKQCDDQLTACNAAQKSAPFQTFSLENLGPDPANADFDLLCAP